VTSRNELQKRLEGNGMENHATGSQVLLSMLHLIMTQAEISLNWRI